MNKNKPSPQEIVVKLHEELLACKSYKEAKLVEIKMVTEITDFELLIKTLHVGYLYSLPQLRKVVVNYLESSSNLADFNFDENSNIILMFIAFYECSQSLFNRLLQNFKKIRKDSKVTVFDKFQVVAELLSKQFGVLKLIYEKNIDIKTIDYLFSEFENYQDKLAYPAEIGMTIVALNQTGASPFYSPLKMWMVKLKNYQASEYDRLQLYKAIIHESYHIYKHTQSCRRNHGEDANVYKFIDEGCAELYGYRVYPNDDFLHLADNISHLHIKKLNIKTADIVYNFRDYLFQRNIGSYKMATSFVKFCDTLLPDKSITDLYVDLFREDKDKNFIDELVEHLGQASLNDLLELWETKIVQRTLNYSTDGEFRCKIAERDDEKIIFNYFYSEPIYVEQNIFVLVNNVHIPLIMLDESRFNATGQFKVITNRNNKIEVLMAVKDKVYSVWV